MTHRLHRGGLSPASRTPVFQDGTLGDRRAPKRPPARVATARIDPFTNLTLSGWLFFSLVVLALLLAAFSPLHAHELPAQPSQAGQTQKAENFATGAALGTAFVSSDAADRATHKQAVSESRDAGIYLDTAIALGSGGLKPYSLDQKDKNAALLPGLLGIATHVYREQRLTTAGDDQGFSYSLADAMADALWRKQVVDSLYRAPEAGLAN